jgi:Spy/CpxP family protein refolding chaperone
MNESNSRPTPRWKPVAGRVLALAAAVAVGVGASWFALSPPAYAADPFTPGPSLLARLHGDHAARMHAHADQVLTEAGVSDAQKKQIRAIVENAMVYQHADFARYHASLRDLKVLLTADTVDAKAIAAVRAEQDELLLAGNQRLVDTFVAAANVLTPAQRKAVGAELDRMMAARLGHHSE